MSTFKIFKKRLQYKCFPVNFAKFLRTPILKNTSGLMFLFLKADEEVWLKLMITFCNSVFILKIFLKISNLSLNYTNFCKILLKKLRCQHCLTLSSPFIFQKTTDLQEKKNDFGNFRARFVGSPNMASYSLGLFSSHNLMVILMQSSNFSKRSRKAIILTFT